jgi:hypothetical protein
VDKHEKHIHHTPGHVEHTPAHKTVTPPHLVAKKQSVEHHHKAEHKADDSPGKFKAELVRVNKKLTLYYATCGRCHQQPPEETRLIARKPGNPHLPTPKDNPGNKLITDKRQPPPVTGPKYPPKVPTEKSSPPRLAKEYPPQRPVAKYSAPPPPGATPKSPKGPQPLTQGPRGQRPPLPGARIGEPKVPLLASAVPEPPLSLPRRNANLKTRWPGDDPSAMQTDTRPDLEMRTARVVDDPLTLPEAELVPPPDYPLPRETWQPTAQLMADEPVLRSASLAVVRASDEMTASAALPDLLPLPSATRR